MKFRHHNDVCILFVLMYYVAEAPLEVVSTRKYNRSGHGSEALGYYKSSRSLKLKKKPSAGFGEVVVVSETTQVEDHGVSQPQTAKSRFRMKQARDQAFANRRAARIALDEVVVNIVMLIMIDPSICVHAV